MLTLIATLAMLFALNAPAQRVAGPELQPRIRRPLQAVPAPPPRIIRRHLPR
ncbi:MAG: hypothetical protein ABR961_03465 [Thermoanaerobaculaceae bacterium]|jgi:hypothetical protein